MDFRALRSFVVLANQLHFGRAASLLHLSQPALSKQIRKLEDEIGAPLFHRDTAGTSLSAAGAVLAKDAGDLLARCGEALLRAQRAGRGEIGTLDIGFGVATYELVPRVIARFRSRYPEIHVSLRDMPSIGQVEALRGRRLDIGFIRLPAPDDLAVCPVTTERLILALPPAAKDIRTLADLQGLPLVLLSRERTHSVFDQVIALCAAFNVTPYIVQEVAEFPTALALVASGVGASLVPHSARRDDLPIVYREIDHPAADWSVGAAWRSAEGDRIIANFLACLGEELVAAGSPTATPIGGTPCR
ncbi:MAG: LysR family transcriptional regulator [Azospirillaceae bacterium]|nr:LysR family transcriptional regulator [Azospirillaceae bacterium]